MNGPVKHFYKFLLTVFTALAITTHAENAPETSIEASIEKPAEPSIETANATVKPEAESDSDVDPEEASQERIFRPSEDISEDLVIAFPVDI